jgi:hypothetical protein
MPELRSRSVYFILLGIMASIAATPPVVVPKE